MMTFKFEPFKIPDSIIERARASVYPEHRPNREDLCVPMMTSLEYFKTGFQKDFQCRRVYRWEDTLRENGGTLNYMPEFVDREVYELLEKVFDYHALPIPIIEFTGANRGRCSFSVGSVNNSTGARKRSRMKLADWGKNHHVILHESAHAINNFADVKRGAHGAEFVTIFMDLMEKFAGYDREEMKRKALEAKIKIIY